MLEKAKPIAAGTARSRRVRRRSIENGNFLVVGTDRRVSLFEVAAQRRRRGGRHARHQGDGRHAADLPERLPRRRGRDRSRHRRDRDRRLRGGGRCRRRARPHAGRRASCVGGLAQGIGQALMENAVYDAGNGAARHRHVHGLRDAARRPTCRRSPRRTTTRRATTNPLGVKGVGEAGTTGSIAAIMNAIANAIPGRPRRQHRHAGDARQGVGGVPRRVRIRRSGLHSLRAVATLLSPERQAPTAPGAGGSAARPLDSRPTFR